jgi:hypothetical protein
MPVAFTRLIGMLGPKAHRANTAGKSEDGLKQLDRLGAITEESDPEKLRKAAMEKHLSVARTGEVSLLACPIHREAREMAAAVKAQLQAEGKISTEEYEVTRIRKLQANVKDPVNYEAGRVVGFRTKVKGGFLPGEKWTVIDRENGTVKLEPDGIERILETITKGQWDVFEAQNFTNNEILKVARINRESVTFSDGRTMKRGLVQIDQGVCVTSHASQGKTVRQVVALMPMTTFSQADAKALYVLASRATHEVQVFTDCKLSKNRSSGRESAPASTRLRKSLIALSGRSRKSKKNRNFAWIS